MFLVVVVVAAVVGFFDVGASSSLPLTGDGDVVVAFPLIVSLLCCLGAIEYLQNGKRISACMIAIAIVLGACPVHRRFYSKQVTQSA